MNDYVLIAINVISWGYVLISYLNSRKITTKCKDFSKVATIFFWGVLSVIIVFKEFDLKNVLYSLLLFISGIIYSFIPNGYNEQAIIIKGRKYPYKKIKDLDINKENGVYRLSFLAYGRVHFLSDDRDKSLLIKCQELYKGAK